MKIKYRKYTWYYNYYLSVIMQKQADCDLKTQMAWIRGKHCYQNFLKSIKKTDCKQNLWKLANF